MSRFTQHFAISPSPDKWGWWVNDKELDYGIDSEKGGRRIKVPAGYQFDGKSVPTWFIVFIGIVGVFMNQPVVVVVSLLGLGIFQKVEADTIVSACIHDYVFTDMRELGRFVADATVYLESLCHRNIPKLVKEKKYILAYMMIIKYSIEVIILLMFSWFVRYKLDKKLENFVRKFKTFILSIYL